jgi:hypothetical protein
VEATTGEGVFRADVTHYSPDPARQFSSDRPAYFHPSDVADFSNLAGETKGRIIQGPLELRNPITLPAEETVDLSPARIKELRDQGYDGVVADDGSEVIAFSPQSQFREVSRKSPAEIAAAEQAPAGAPPPVRAQPPEIGVAARYREEQQPGSVIPGTVQDAEYWRGHGREFINKGGDPRIAVRAAGRGEVSPRNVGIVSAEYERLAEQTHAAAQVVEANPTNPQARAALDAATQAQAAWSKEMQPVFTRAGESLAAIQGRLPVDETTFAGLYSKALQLSEGVPPTKGQQVDMFRRAQKVSRAKTAERQSYAKLDKAVPGRVPSDAEMRARVDDIVRRLTPCD